MATSCNFQACPSKKNFKLILVLHLSIEAALSLSLYFTGPTLIEKPGLSDFDRDFENFDLKFEELGRIMKLV